MATSIAHFTLPPNRRVATTEQIGVIAFHVNDIQHVAFSINGGAATNVTTRTKVTDTDVKGKTVTHWEYQIEFDPSLYADGAVTFDVSAVPVTGTTRVLPQMTLHANSGGTLDGSVLTVNSDANPGGAGTYDTIKAALTAAASNGGDIIELLQEGSYSCLPADIELDIARADVDYWTTIRGASGLNLQNVVLNRATRGNIRPKCDRIKWEHLAFDTNSLAQLYLEDTGYTLPRIGDLHWIHDCYINDSAGWTSAETYNQPFFRGPEVVDGIMVTDSEAYDVVFGLAASKLQRNCYQRRVGSDAYKGDVFVLNSSLYEMVGSTRTAIDSTHADVCQCIGNQENVIFYNVEGANLIDVQGIHTDQAGTPSYDDVAFINYSMQIDDGAPVCSILGACDHFLMYNVSIPEQALSFRELDGGGGALFTAVDFDVRNSVFDAVTSQGGGALTGVTVNNSHSITTAIAVGWGSGNTQSSVDMAASGVLGSWTYTGAGLSDITESGEVLVGVDFPDWTYSSTTTPNKGSWPQGAWPAAAGGGSGVVQIEDVTVTTNAYATTTNIAVGTTDANSEILIVAMQQGTGVIHTAPANFTSVLNMDIAAITQYISVWRWDGTGTRPNGTNVTITSDTLEVFGGASIIVSGCSGIGNTATSTVIADTSSTGNTITATLNSLILHVAGHRNDVAITVTAPTPVPSINPALSTDEGIFPADAGSTQTNATFITDGAVAAGTTDAAASTHSYAGVMYGTIELLVAEAAVTTSWKDATSGRMLGRSGIFNSPFISKKH